MNNQVEPELPEAPKHIYSFIRGRYVEESAGEIIPVINPATEQTVTRLVAADEAEVGRAVAAAKQTFDNGTWARVAVRDKQKILRRVGELLSEYAGDIAARDALCTGLLYHHSLAPQVHAAADWFDYFADFIGTREEEIYRQLPGAKTLVTYEPVGVAGLYTPWNIPVMSASLKLSAALAFGNSCVLKPSEQSPWGVARLVELAHEAGVPDGVVNMVNGYGPVTGASLSGHEDVNAISFTGGARAGAAISAAAGRRFARITMELGGKGANIIFADADLDRAMDAALVSIFSNNGQACLAGSRLLIQRRIADEFIDRFVARTRKIRIGDPFDRNAELGPLSSRAHMERVLSYVDIATAENGAILTGGKRAQTMPAGYFVEPTVSLAESNNSRVCQEEIFGPFAAVLVFDTEEQAVAIANDTSYGLAAYIWSGDLGRAVRMSDKLRSGYILINSVMQREKNAPFGGFGQSGLGREGGRHSKHFFTEPKATVIGLEKSAINKMGSS